jgi:hypothetical protein
MWFISYIHFHFSLFFIFFFVLRVLLNLTKVVKQERQKYHLWCFFFKKTNNSSFDGNPSHVMVEINDLYNVVFFFCWLFVIRSIILVLSVCVYVYISHMHAYMIFILLSSKSRTTILRNCPLWDVIHCKRRFIKLKNVNVSFINYSLSWFLSNIM